MTAQKSRESRFHSAVQASRPPRRERVASQLREELTGLMLRDMKDPRVRMASVSRVHLSPDLRSARVMVSALGDDPERQAVVSAMRHAEGYLRTELGHRLENLRYTPHLRFELDESIAYSVRISSMLNQLGGTATAAAGDTQRTDMTDTLQRTDSHQRSWPALEEVIGDIRRVIDGAEDIGCLTHVNADADSMGSALGFAEAVRAMGKRSHLIVPTPVPRLLEYLPGYDTIELEPGHLDALFTFDCANVSRFGDRAPLVEQIAEVVNIDHHVSNEGFGRITLVDPTAAATGQVVFRLLTALGVPIPPNAATNLYAALFTDTGGFRHENTTEDALRLGADLVRLGADAPWVAMKSYKSRSLSQVRLEGLVIGRLRDELEGRLVWSEVTENMLADAGASAEETEGLVDMLQSIDTMRLAVLFKEEGEGSATKISVRTRDPLDATVLCSPFGGGGHHRAAGAEIRAPLADARETVLASARELVRATA